MEERAPDSPFLRLLQARTNWGKFWKGGWFRLLSTNADDGGSVLVLGLRGFSTVGMVHIRVAADFRITLQQFGYDAALHGYGVVAKAGLDVPLQAAQVSIFGSMPKTVGLSLMERMPSAVGGQVILRHVMRGAIQ